MGITLRKPTPKAKREKPPSLKIPRPTAATQQSGACVFYALDHEWHQFLLWRSENPKGPRAT